MNKNICADSEEGHGICNIAQTHFKQLEEALHTIFAPAFGLPVLFALAKPSERLTQEHENERHHNKTDNVSGRHQRYIEEHRTDQSGNE